MNSRKKSVDTKKLFFCFILIHFSLIVTKADLFVTLLSVPGTNKY